MDLNINFNFPNNPQSMKRANEETTIVNNRNKKLMISSLLRSNTENISFENQMLLKEKLEKNCELNFSQKNHDIQVIKKHRTIKEKLERNIEFAQKDLQSQKDDPFIQEKFQIAFKLEPLQEKMTLGWYFPETKITDFVNASAHFTSESKINSQSDTFKLLNQDVISAAISSCQGYRPTMEDEALIKQSGFSIKDTIHTMTVFGVFDGHGGSATSNHVKKQVFDYILDSFEDCNMEELNDEDIFTALKRAIEVMDDELEGDEAFQGTTLALAILLANKIWVVNTGDSRTILIDHESKVTQASDDMKLSAERYRAKIGNYIKKRDNGVERLDGRLTMARAIGDHTMKHISPNPKITCYDYDRFKKGKIVIACDGLWDVSSSKNVGECIDMMKEKSALEISQRLVFSAITAGSTDNVTVLVVNL